MSSILDISPEYRKIARDRVEELKGIIREYTQYAKTIPCGLHLEEEFQANRKRIIKALKITENEWNDWQWQLKNQVRTLKKLEKIIVLNDRIRQDILRTEKKFRWAVSPYYASLMSRESIDCPVRKQSIPTILELEDRIPEQSMAVTFRSPAPLITQYYPDRVILNVTNRCSTFCRHCLRRRDIGSRDLTYGKKYLNEALLYLQQNSFIRDVLITGGDALSLNDDHLDDILDRIKQISHIEIMRIGTRMPVVMPMRITDELCSLLKKYENLYINTQYNHPKEITCESKQAIAKLLSAGIIVRNQTVLLKGINNHPFVMKKLMQELVRIRVVPYYIFNCKKIKGITHFRTTLQEGKAIMEEMVWKTTGFCIPRYIATTPSGKVPLNPDGLITYIDGGVPLLRAGDGTFVPYV